MPTGLTYTKTKIDALLAALPAGGIPGRTVIATPSTFGVAASGTGKIMTPGGYSFTDQETGAASSLLVYHSASGSIGMATAGWWFIGVQAEFGFNVGTTALPDHVLARVSTYYDSIETTASWPCSAAPGYSASRNRHGCEGRLTTHIFRQEISSVTSGGIKPTFLWPGDAAPKSPSGGTNPFIRLFATRVG